jgi:hypothetical protein
MKILAALESYDLQCAIHRWGLTSDPEEISALTTTQLIAALKITRAEPHWPIWKLAEERLGRPIFTHEINSHG